MGINFSIPIMTEIDREDRVIMFQVAKLAKEKGFNWGTDGEPKELIKTE